VNSLDNNAGNVSYFNSEREVPKRRILERISNDDCHAPLTCCTVRSPNEPDAQGKDRKSDCEGEPENLRRGVIQRRENIKDAWSGSDLCGPLSRESDETTP
jgi:hypothetical protein